MLEKIYGPECNIDFEKITELDLTLCKIEDLSGDIMLPPNLEILNISHTNFGNWKEVHNYR
eukprot:UN03577